MQALSDGIEANRTDKLKDCGTLEMSAQSHLPEAVRQFGALRSKNGNTHPAFGISFGAG